MSTRNTQMTLLERFRRASVLRVVFVVAAFCASQNSLACALEEAMGAQGIELSAGVSADVVALDALASGEDLEDGCCTLCFDCANCGGCHTSAVSPRIDAAHLAFVSIAFAKISLAPGMRTPWAPPALLRPPIDAA
jgi:hypothetical protein